MKFDWILKKFAGQDDMFMTVDKSENTTHAYFKNKEKRVWLVLCCLSHLLYAWQPKRFITTQSIKKK